MPTTRNRRDARRSLALHYCVACLVCARGLGFLVLVLIANRVGAEQASVEPPASSWWSDALWKYSTGLDYSRGDYGLEDETAILYLPISVEADFFPVRAKLTLPVLKIEGDGGVLRDGSRVDGSASGIGQIVGSVGYLWVPASRPIPFLELTGKLTIPSETSDELGNGEWAFALQGDAFENFGRLSTFARLGRKFYTGSSLDDRFYASVGASLRLDDWVRLGVAYDWYQASVDSVEDSHELSPFVAIKIGSSWSMGPYFVIGLSDGSADYGLGFTISLRR